jgi:RNA polymerase sigma-70 factor (ECF subfamily)
MPDWICAARRFFKLCGCFRLRASKIQQGNSAWRCNPEPYFGVISVKMVETGELVTAAIKAGASLSDAGGWMEARPAAVKIEAAINLEDFSAWMAAEQRRIYLLCLRFLRNSEDADLATQDAFLKAYRALGEGKTPVIEMPAKWITRIAVNTCLDRLRSRRWLFWRQRASSEEEKAVFQLTPASGPGPEAALSARDISRRLSAALNRLSSRQRSVFVLRHEEDLSLQEIGELLGLDLGTVKAHMARALKKLRRELRDLYGK